MRPRALSVALAAALSCGPALVSAQYSSEVSTPGAGVETQGEGRTEQTPTQATRRRSGIVPSIFVEETLTNNVGLRTTESRKSDFITEIAPRLRMSGGGAYVSGDANISVPIFFYARTGSENNRAVPQVNASGVAELLKNHFFIDGQVQVSQEYFSPFGARSESLANRTNNEYTAQTYRISPHFHGTGQDELSYELRDNNTWTRTSSTPVATSNSYLNELIGNVIRRTRPLGWALDYKRSDLTFQSAPSQITEISHARVLYRPDPQLEIDVSGGYEEAKFPLVSYNNVTYGAGFRWRPTERARADASWEHRFFGSAYHIDFSNRTALTSWSVLVSRDISSYPELLAQLQAGGVTASLLDSVFRSRIPDPALREQFVQQYIQEHGLPATLTAPISVYNQLVTIHERASVTGGILGALNSVFLTVFRSHLEPLAGNLGLQVPLVQAQSNNTQLGAGLHWGHTFSRAVSLNTTADYSHTTSNGGFASTTNFASLRTVLTQTLTPSTSLHAGARFQRNRSTASEDFKEFAIYAGFTHTFR